MKSLKNVMRSITKFFSKKNIKKLTTRAAKVAEQVTAGKVIVTKDEDILLDEPTTAKVVRRVASVAVAIAGMVLFALPLNLRFAMEAGDRLIRIATMMWDGEQWTQTALI